jgi:protease II
MVSQEMVERERHHEHSLEERLGDYVYYTRTPLGSEFPLFCRARVDGGEEEVLLDQTALARDEAYISLPVVKVSPDHSLLLYTKDTTGTERYSAHIIDLRSGRHLPVRKETRYIRKNSDNIMIIVSEQLCDNRPSSMRLFLYLSLSLPLHATAHRR